MGEEGKNMEDIFKEKFEGFSPAPPDGLWDKIASQIDTPPPAIVKPWWKTWRIGLFFLFLFVSITGIIYSLNDETVILNNKSLLIENPGNSKITTNKTDRLSSQDLNTNEKRSVSTSSLVTPTYTTSNNKKSEIRENLENSIVISETSTSKLNQKQKLKDSKNNALINNEVKDISSTNEKPKSIENQYLIAENNQPINNNNGNNIPSNHNIQTSVDEILNKTKRYDAPILPFIIRDDIFESEFVHLMANKLEERDIETKHKKPIMWYLGAYGGPSIVYRRFESNHSLMQSHKQSAESSLLSYDWGFEVVAQKGNWEIFVGLQLDRLGENYAYEGMKEVHDTSITQHQHPQDPTVWIYDTAISVHHNHIEHNSNNIYTYFSIPLSIGYQFHLNEKFAISPIITGGLNFLRTAETAWLDPETLNPVLHNSQDHQDAFRKVNFSNRFQIGFYYQLSEKFSLIVRPEATVLWQSVFNNSEFLNHRPYSFDANIGLRYQIR